MLSASLVDTRTVRLDGLKPQWRIAKSEDVVMIDGGEAFIRMSPCSTGLSSLVAAENPSPRARAEALVVRQPWAYILDCDAKPETSRRTVG